MLHSLVHFALQADDVTVSNNPNMVDARLVSWIKPTATTAVRLIAAENNPCVLVDVS